MNKEISTLHFLSGRKSLFTGSFLIILLIAVILIFSGSGNYVYWVIPSAIVLLLAALLSIEKFLLLTVFLVPLSIQLRFIMPEPPADLFLPTEPMLAVIMVIMLFKTFASGETDKRILHHPVTIIIFTLLAWLFITSLTGTMPLVSMKYLVARIWFITGFFLLATQLFSNNRMAGRYFYAYLGGMTPVAIYYLFRLSQYGVLNQETAYAAIRPFFNDHTALGASLAFCIPACLLLLLRKGNSFFTGVFLFLQLALFASAFLFSYSRAAWISLAAAGVVAIILVLKVSWKIIVPALTVLAIVVIASWSAMMIRIGENRQDSSLNFEKQLRSISNIRTDVSNLERINRWNSAVRMSAERPLLGWGPGTYQFNYGPFQLAAEKTGISTSWGEGGNAHSEYLGLLSESGIPGMIIYIVLIVVILKKGISLFRKAEEKETRILILCMVTGLVTYIVHGTLNNFLDTDKISALFWGMTAVIVAADLKKSAGETPAQ